MILKESNSPLSEAVNLLPKEARQVHSSVEQHANNMLTVIFDIHGFVYHESVPQDKL
jgi:hypothetical protein